MGTTIAIVPVLGIPFSKNVWFILLIIFSGVMCRALLVFLCAASALYSGWGVVDG